MKRGMAETILGGLVLLVTTIFLIYAVQFIDKDNNDVINLKARFYKVGDLDVGNEVKISGVNVGVVTSRVLDRKKL